MKFVGDQARTRDMSAPRIVRGHLDRLTKSEPGVVAGDVAGVALPEATAPELVAAAEPATGQTEPSTVVAEGAPPPEQSKSIIETLNPGDYRLPGGYIMRYTGSQISFEPNADDAISTPARAGTMEQRIAGQVRLIVSFAVVTDDQTDQAPLVDDSADVVAEEASDAQA